MRAPRQGKEPAATERTGRMVTVVRGHASLHRGRFARVS